MAIVQIVELTPENTEAVIAPMMAYHLEISERIKREMTEIQAQLVRGWRVGLGCTWGAIGSRWSELYPWDDGGQILGKALCYRAAMLLNEDPHDEPWN